MTTSRRVAHTASFLQTFHTGRTAVQRRDDLEAQADEYAAMMFVKGPAPVEAQAAVAHVRPTAPYVPASSPMARESQCLECGRTHRNGASCAPATPAEQGEFIHIRGYKVRIGDGLITKPQAKWIVSIALDSEGVTPQMMESLKIRLEQGMAKFAASQFISTYKDLPKKSREAAKLEAIAPMADSMTEYRAATKPQAPTQDGIYVDRETGRIFKLQFNRGEGDGKHLYAKQLVISFWRGDEEEEHDKGLLDLDFDGVERRANGKPDVRNSWEYRPGLIKQVRSEWRLTPESAVEWGALYGSCIRCHRDLTKESSIRQMMGDTCAGKQGF